MYQLYQTKKLAQGSIGSKNWSRYEPNFKTVSVLSI